MRVSLSSRVPRAPTASLVVLALAWLAAPGCTSARCDEENLPNRGHASTPEVLARLVQHEAKHDCRSRLYDLLSAKTRDKYSRTEWRLGLSHISVPDPYDYKVIDVMEHGSFVEALINPAKDDEAFAYYDYQEAGKKPLRLKLLLLKQIPDESPVEVSAGGGAAVDRREWRVGLLDQDALISAKPEKYWWFDEVDPH